MTWHNPLVLLLIIPVGILMVYLQRRKLKSGLRFSSGNLLAGLKPSLKVRLGRNLWILRVLAVALSIIALARPQSPVLDSKIETEGIDIVLALDCSGSMLAEDFKMNGRRESRVEVVKRVVKDFIQGRSNDRIGLVAFAARAYTVCPLTLDYSWLESNLERVKVGTIEDGTSVGSGIAASLNRIKNTKAKSKIIILLTDGRNNTGNISPQTAAEAAKALKVKIYTIGVGSRGPVPYPVKDYFGNTVYQQVDVDLDEDSLKKIAETTNAKYFRATDTESLKEIYREIDQMEKTPLESKGFQEYSELFPVFLIPGLIILLLEIILTRTYLRQIP